MQIDNASIKIHARGLNTDQVVSGIVKLPPLNLKVEEQGARAIMEQICLARGNDDIEIAPHRMMSEFDSSRRSVTDIFA